MLDNECCGPAGLGLTEPLVKSHQRLGSAQDVANLSCAGIELEALLEISSGSQLGRVHGSFDINIRSAHPPPSLGVAGRDVELVRTSVASRGRLGRLVRTDIPLRILRDEVLRSDHPKERLEDIRPRFVGHPKDCDIPRESTALESFASLRGLEGVAGRNEIDCVLPGVPGQYDFWLDGE